MTNEDDKQYFRNSKILLAMNQDSPNYKWGFGRRCKLATADYTNTPDYFFPDKNLYSNLKSPELKKRYIYLFLVYSDPIYEDKFPLCNEEKELILFHAKNEKCDEEFIITCCKWASYYDLNDEKEMFLNRVNDVNMNFIDLIMYICRNDDITFFTKLITHPKFTMYSDALKYTCIHSDNWTLVKLLLEKEFDSHQESINRGIKHAIRCRKNVVVKELIPHISCTLNKLMEYAVKHNNIDIIKFLIDSDEKLKYDFVQMINIDYLISATNFEYNVIKLFAETVNNAGETGLIKDSVVNNASSTGLIKDSVVNNADFNNIDSELILHTIIFLAKYYKKELLIKIINMKNNSVRDYNKLFNEILRKNDICNFIEIYKLIPIEFNQINSETKETIFKFVRNINIDRVNLDNLLLIMDIIGDLDIFTSEEIVKNILSSNLNDFLNKKIEILKIIINKKPFVAKLIDDMQEEIYYLGGCSKLWVENFPIKSENLMNIMNNITCYEKKLVKYVPIRDILQDKYIPCIYDKIIDIIENYYDLDIDGLHLWVSSLNANKEECISIINNLFNSIENKATHFFIAILLLKLKIYDFDDNNINIILHDYDYQIIIDWCMRQYIIHNLNTKVIWTCILKRNHKISYKTIFIFDYVRNILDEDITLNICMILQLIGYWEDRDANLSMFYDYEIVLPKKDNLIIDYW